MQPLLSIVKVNSVQLPSFDCTSLPPHNSDTDTADEDETVCIPEPLGSLFESQTINISDRELIDYASKVNEGYVRSDNQKHFESLRQITKVQSLSPIWMIHHVGRITASVAKRHLEPTLRCHQKPSLIQSCSINHKLMFLQPFTGKIK